MSDPAARGWQRPSIYDVAKHAGVSHMTVSRVLNGHPNIRESTWNRVPQAIEEMNYTPSSIARALATRRAMRIGVIVDSPVQFGPNSTLLAVERAARAAGYAISSYSLSDDEDSRIDAGVVELVTQGVDALCVIAPRASSLDVLRRQVTGLPTLAIKAEPEAAMHTIAVDQHAGAVLAVTHLMELDAIAATVIGGTLLTGGAGYVLGSVVGAFVLGLMNVLVTRDGTIKPEMVTIITGGILLVFVVLQRAVTARQRE